MNGGTAALLIVALVVLDVAGLITLAYFWRRGASGRSVSHSSETGSRSSHPLPTRSRERYTERLGELDLAIQDGRYEAALEMSDLLISDVLTERGFPEESRRGKKALGQALHAIDPEAAGDYAGARTHRYMASGPLVARPEKERKLGEAARGYRDACEALIGADRQ